MTIRDKDLEKILAVNSSASVKMTQIYEHVLIQGVYMAGQSMLAEIAAVVAAKSANLRAVNCVGLADHLMETVDSLSSENPTPGLEIALKQLGLTWKLSTTEPEAPTIIPSLELNANRIPENGTNGTAKKTRRKRRSPAKTENATA